MRRFKDKNTNGWKCGEKSVIEIGTDKEFILTQSKILFEEDGYHVKRAIACENCPADVIAEPDFFVYEVAYMPDGYSLCIRTVDEETMLSLVSMNLQAFLNGNARNAINEFFNCIF